MGKRGGSVAASWFLMIGEHATRRRAFSLEHPAVPLRECPARLVSLAISVWVCWRFDLVEYMQKRRGGGR
ncbi:hypothetical protein NL676_038185 [Syzygium grande]|nr:hypothetical protein NL676_038185 [Syzygium grande]